MSIDPLFFFWILTVVFVVGTIFGHWVGYRLGRLTGKHEGFVEGVTKQWGRKVDDLDADLGERNPNGAGGSGQPRSAP